MSLLEPTNTCSTQIFHWKELLSTKCYKPNAQTPGYTHGLYIGNESSFEDSDHKTLVQLDHINGVIRLI